MGIRIDLVEEDEFRRRMEAVLQDPDKSELVQSLVAYSAGDDGRFRVMNGWETKEYTAQVLMRLGFHWSFTTWDYIEKYLLCLKGLGVFDNDFRR